jgi:hypothetical protein
MFKFGGVARGSEVSFHACVAAGAENTHKVKANM